MAKIIPVTIPKVDNIEDLRTHVVTQLNRVVRHLAVNQSQQSQPMSMGQNPINDVADPAHPTDAVNLRTLRQYTVSDMNNKHRTSGGTGSVTQRYTVVFSFSGLVSSPASSPPYIIMPNRAGIPTMVRVCAGVTNTGTSSFNIAYSTQSGINAPVQVKLLATDILLGSGTYGPITATNFIASLPTLQSGWTLFPVVDGSGGHGNVTLECEIQVS